MIRRHVARSAWLGLLMTLGLGPSPASAQQSRLPSEVLHDIAKGRLENRTWRPPEVEAALKPLLQSVQTTGLSADEEVALALAYFFTFDGLSAKPLFEKHMDRADRLGRVAWQSLQQMSFFGAKDYPLVERRLGEFRSKFPVIPEDPEYTYNMVNNLARYYASQGDHARAVSLILADLEQLPLDTPLRSFELVGVHFASFQAVGQPSVAIGWMKRHHSALKARDSAQNAIANLVPPTNGTSIAHRSGVIHLTPFADLLYPDDPSWTVAMGDRYRRVTALERFGRWIGAAERGEAIPPQ